MASILCMRLSLVRRMGQPRFSRLRVVCISHSTSDFVPPCNQIQNSNARVLDCFSRFSYLLDFSFLFQCREIPRRCCVGYMKQFLDFIVGDFALCVQGFQNLFEFLVLPVLNRCAGFHEEIASGMRGLQ